MEGKEGPVLSRTERLGVSKAFQRREYLHCAPKDHAAKSHRCKVLGRVRKAGETEGEKVGRLESCSGCGGLGLRGNTEVLDWI